MFSVVFKPISTCLAQLSPGTFLQVTFLEIITPEFRHRDVNQVAKVGAMAVGLALIAALMQIMHNFGPLHCPDLL